MIAALLLGPDLRALNHLPARFSARSASRFPACCPGHRFPPGMFELNNLAVYVGSPVTRWLQALERLPDGERAAAYQAAGAAWGSPVEAGAMRERGAAFGCSHPADRHVLQPTALPGACPPPACAAPFLEALPEELPGCDGNAFYALHRWAAGIWARFLGHAVTACQPRALWSATSAPAQQHLPPRPPACAAAAATTAAPPAPRPSSATRTRTAAVRGGQGPRCSARLHWCG